MSQAGTAAAMERLPWLADEPIPQSPPPAERRSSLREVAGWAVAAVLLVAGASYWVGVHSGEAPVDVSTPSRSTTVPLPAPSEPQQPQVITEPVPQVAPVPQVTPAPQTAAPIARAPATRRSVERRPSAQPRHKTQSAAAAVKKQAPAATATATPAKPAANSDSKPLTVWPAWQSKGADGRIVRIGAFGTRDQAKLGWRYMVRAYPAVAHLKATVVADHNSHGRRFYRFQIGTTSQAHSEVLCQRMERIRLSCAVVGLPWKPHGVER